MESLTNNLNQIAKEVKSVGPFLAPYIKAACLYFIIHHEPGTLVHLVVKLLPIWILLAFVWFQGLKGNWYNQWIMIGLALCSIGDTLLVWQDKSGGPFFIGGMLFFALGHIAYLIGFGLKPFGLKEFILVFVVVNAILICIYPCLSPPLSYAIPVYGYLIGAMWWRALARFTLKGDIPWRKVYAAAGATLFCLSDCILAVNKFCHPLPYEVFLIMSMYYTAQMLIAVSIINSRVFCYSGGNKNILHHHHPSHSATNRSVANGLTKID